MLHDARLSPSGVPELYLAIHCCRAEIFAKLGDQSKFNECLAIVRSGAKEARPSSKLFPYLSSKIRVFNGAVSL